MTYYWWGQKDHVRVHGIVRATDEMMARAQLHMEYPAISSIDGIELCDWDEDVRFLREFSRLLRGSEEAVL
jgi:hypothetical protein